MRNRFPRKRGGETPAAAPPLLDREATPELYGDKGSDLVVDISDEELAKCKTTMCVKDSAKTFITLPKGQQHLWHRVIKRDP